MRKTAFVLALAACASPAVQAPDGERHTVRVDVPPSDAGVVIQERPAPSRRLATSGTHACVVTIKGRVQCWGENREGELGRGTESWGEPRPAWVDGIDDATEVAAGSGSTCVIHRAGNVSCWGEVADATKPRTVPDIARASRIAVEGARACAVIAEGDIVCWGPKEGPRPVEGKGNKLAERVRTNLPEKSDRFAKLEDVLQIASHNGHACALHADDRVTCSGENAHGQLGLGDTIGTHAKPVVSHTGATSVRAAYSGACALDAAGAVTCWGGGDPKKVPVEDAPKAERLLESIDFGGMCALPKDPARDVVCWKLHAPRKAVPVVGLRGATAQARHAGQSTEWVYAIVKGTLHAWRPNHETRKLETRAIAAAPNLVHVATDSRAVCVLDKNGKATCANAIDPFVSDAKHSWVPVEASTKLREMTVSAGAHVCALEESGTVSCSQDHELPADKVRLVPQKAFSPANHLARGYNLCAHGRDDVLRCATGLDSRGAGQGDQVHVMSNFGAWKDVAGVASTSTFVCFWTKSGEVRCAGSNDEKQLGIEDAARSQEPRQVALER